MKSVLGDFLWQYSFLWVLSQRRKYFGFSRIGDISGGIEEEEQERLKCFSRCDYNARLEDLT